MSATGERSPRPSRRLIASLLALLAACLPAWWAAEARGEGSGAPVADHPDDSDLPALSGLPEPSPGLGLVFPLVESSTVGAARRLLRPPRG